MNDSRFDLVVRTLADGASTRRALARGLAGVAIAGSLAHLGLDDLQARKRNNRKKRKKKSPVNRFGCRNVGVACASADQCCSGICDGRRGKKGKKTCRAHDASDCRVAQDSCSGTNFTCITTTGEEGFCHVTTGNAAYCAQDGVDFDCTKDEDCIPFCGPLAACNVCAVPGEAEFRFCGGPSGCSTN